MRNIELLEKTMQFIKDNPEKHDQTTWCGTAQCFAGWAATLSGWNRVGAVCMERCGVEEWASVVAQGLLGLTTREADFLFNGGNTREDLELMVKDLVNGDELG